MARIKAVKAWAVVNRDGLILPGKIFTEYDIEDDVPIAHRPSLGERVIQVEIVPVEEKEHD